MKKSLTRAERLHKKHDITTLLHSADRVRVEGLTLLFKARADFSNRVAVFTRRGFKNAVNRNRQRRILKEIYREYKHRIKNGFDFIFILSPGLYSYVQLQKWFFEILKARHLLET